jgi:dTDP-4-amino-4,6-dideoxygalactose transaminase
VAADKPISAADLTASAPQQGRIPFNRVTFVGSEQRYMAEAIERWHISGDGHFTDRCQSLLERELSAAKVLLTTSCTSALEMAALLLDIGPGDEVIVPSFTFVSTANAFVLRGARPVFADIRPDTLNLDESQLPRLITSRTKAVVVVHYAGVACEMDEILEIGQRYGIAVVEDNAHGLFGKYKGRYLGTLAPLATQSFHETKNFTCGEGGALVINDPRYVDRAEVIREKGTNRRRFFRGEIDKYTWVDVGSSFLPSDLLAAFLLAQLEARDQIQCQRHHIWNYYATHLSEWADAAGVRLPVVPSYCDHSAHMFHMIMPTEAARRRLIERLKAREIYSVFHYVPLHLSEMGLSYGGRVGDCPVTEQVSDCLVRLPFFNAMTDADLERVTAAVVDSA